MEVFEDTPFEPEDLFQPSKAYNNKEFLNSPAARQIRVQCEMLEPYQRLRKLGINNTIVFFGSARTLEPKEAEEQLERTREEVKRGGASPTEKERLLQAAEFRVKTARYRQAATELAREIAAWSKENIKRPEDQFYICSGGGPGMMEGANKGADLAGQKSVGLGISLPFEQGVNKYVPKELAFEFHYFFIRKYWFVYLAKAMVVFPGGFGTMDELFEILTLRQTTKVKKYIPTVLFGSDFWNDIINFESFVKWGVISEGDLELFQILDSVEDAKEYIISELKQHHL